MRIIRLHSPELRAQLQTTKTVFSLQASRSSLKDRLMLFTAPPGGAGAGLGSQCAGSSLRTISLRSGARWPPSLRGFHSLTNRGLDRTWLEIPLLPPGPDYIYHHLERNTSAKPPGLSLQIMNRGSRALLSTDYAPVSVCQLLERPHFPEKRSFVNRGIMLKP